MFGTPKIHVLMGITGSDVIWNNLYMGDPGPTRQWSAEMDNLNFMINIRLCPQMWARRVMWTSLRS